jgi:hypothetical protein
MHGNQNSLKNRHLTKEFRFQSRKRNTGQARKPEGDRQDAEDREQLLDLHQRHLPLHLR